MTIDDVALRVVDVLNKSDIPFMLAGGFSSNYHGIPRSTKDADFVVQLSNPLNAAFARTLGPEFEAESQLSFETNTGTQYRRCMWPVGACYWIFATVSVHSASVPLLQIRREATNVVVQFDGRLLQAARPEGPYTNVTGAVSPYPLQTATASAGFWRAQHNLVGGEHRFSAGSGHSIALQADGTLWAWGANSSGQLGDGTTTNHPAPTLVATNLNRTWRAVSAGGFHSLALATDGSLWAWG